MGLSKLKKKSFLHLFDHLGEVDWDAVLTEDDINASFSTFNELIAYNIATFVPLSRYTSNNFPK